MIIFPRGGTGSVSGGGEIRKNIRILYSGLLLEPKFLYPPHFLIECIKRDAIRYNLMGYFWVDNIPSSWDA